MVRAAPDLLLLPAGGAGPAAAMREGLGGPGLTVEEVRERTDGRIEGQFRFDSVAALCAAPLFRRDCGYETRETADGAPVLDFRMRIPRSAGLQTGIPAGGDPLGRRPPGAPVSRPAYSVDSEGGGRADPGAARRAEIRIRTEGRIRAHNADGRIERGNVLVWSRPLDRLRDGGMDIRFTTEARSVLAYTARTVGRSALIALGIAGTALLLLFAEGRRRLRRERRTAAASVE